MCFRLYCMYCKDNFGKTKSFFMKRFSSYLQWFWKEKLVCHRHLANCVNRAESSCFDSVLSDGDNARITKCFLSSYCFISVSSGTISTVASSSFFSDSPCLIVCACSRWLFALCFPWSPGLQASDGNGNFTLRCFTLLGFNFKNVWLGQSGLQWASIYIIGKCSSPTKSSPEACSFLFPFASVFSNHQHVSANQFYRKVFRFESFDIYGKLVVLFVISFNQRGRISHILVGSCPLDSGKGQIMEEVQFKRVIIEWVPVDKVKYAPSVPKSERNRPKKKMILWSYMCSLVNCWAVLRFPCDPPHPHPLPEYMPLSSLYWDEFDFLRGFEA